MFSISVVVVVASASVMLTKADTMTAYGVYPNAFQKQTQPMMHGSASFPYMLYNSAINRNQPTFPYVPPPPMQMYPFPGQMPALEQSMNLYNPLNLLIQSAAIRLIMYLTMANKNQPFQANTGPFMNNIVPTFQYPMADNEQYQRRPEAKINLGEEILKQHQQDANQQEQIINNDNEARSEEEKPQNPSNDYENIDEMYDVIEEEEEEEDDTLKQLQKDEEEIEKERREAQEQIRQEQLESSESDESYEIPQIRQQKQSKRWDDTFQTLKELERPLENYGQPPLNENKILANSPKTASNAFAKESFKRGSPMK